MSVLTNKVKLSELVKAHYGKALKQENRNSAGEFDVFGSSGLVGKHDQKLFDYPSIIIGRKGSVGALTFAANGGWVIDTAYYTDIIDSERLDIRYLFHALNAIDLEKDTITTSIPGLNRDALLGNSISLPPIKEQKRIAAILDKADSLRCKRAQAIALADDFLRATFLDMFGDPVTNPKGWPVRRMGDLVEFKGGSQPPKEVFINEPRDDYVRLIQIRDFKSDKYPTYIPEKLAKREFSKDDVMIARYGPPVFQILRGLSGSYNVALMKAIPKLHLTKEFVFWLLQLPAYHDVVVANSERTAGQTGVNLDLLNEMQVPLPSQEVVEELDAKTRKISAFIKKQNLMLEELSAMSAGLAAEYF